MNLKHIIMVIISLVVIGLHFAIQYNPKHESAYVKQLRVMLNNCSESVYTNNDCKNIKAVLARYVVE